MQACRARRPGSHDTSIETATIRPVPWRSSAPSPVHVTVGLNTASELVTFWSVIVSVFASTMNEVVSSAPGTCSVQLSLAVAPSLS